MHNRKSRLMRKLITLAFSILFTMTAFGQRLISQMYFEGDPLIARCPIINTVQDKAQMGRLIAPLDMSKAVPMDCLAYKFDIVLRGRRQTMFENQLEGM